MTTIHFDVPDAVLSALHRSADELTREVRLLAAMEWYGQAAISQGTAAAIAGMSRAEFMDALAQAGRDVFVVDFDELERELQRG